MHPMLQTYWKMGYELAIVSALREGLVQQSHTSMHQVKHKSCKAVVADEQSQRANSCQIRLRASICLSEVLCSPNADACDAPDHSSHGRQNHAV